MTLSQDQLDQYHRDGFLVVEDLLPREDVEALSARLREYTHGERHSDGLKIQTEPRVSRGELQVSHPGDGIRKIDGLVEADDLFQALGKHPSIVGAVEQILGPDIKMFRNSLLLKPPQVFLRRHDPSIQQKPLALVGSCNCGYRSRCTSVR